MRKAAFLLFAGVAGVSGGCFGPNLGTTPFACGDHDTCPEGYHCALDQCWRDGLEPPDAAVIDSRPAPDVPWACTPSSVTCSADDVVTCNASGQVASTVTCPAGCIQPGNGNARCLILTPSNISSTVCDTAASTDLNITADTRLDTTGCTTLVAQASGGVDLCLFKVRDFTVASGAGVRIVGKYMPVFVATRTMMIRGTIDVGGHWVAAAPSPGPGASVGDGTAGTNGDGGGGGGENGDGLNGGGGNNHGAPSNGGSHHGANALTPLVCGGTGGQGAMGGTSATEVGAAGGGIQLVACADLQIGSAALINAGGGGGGGGTGDSTIQAPGGGSGGGSGGSILIEAPQVIIPIGARIVANGGAGGGGGGHNIISVTTAGPGSHGSDGPTTASPAMHGVGGTGQTSNGGNGGDGGSSDGTTGTPPTVGADSAGGGGGGGGAAGRIRMNARADRAIQISNSAIVSPYTPGAGSPELGNIARH